jgi:2-dehydropantoate 2-reductase
MLQDVLRGAPTEIEQLNGAVVRAAERLGVAVPVNRRLWRAVAALAVGPVRAGADASC